MDKLIDEMTRRIGKARSRASKVKINENNLGDQVFIYPNTEDSVFNPKYLSVFNYYQLIELEDFLKKYEDLNDENLDEILRASKEFRFLKKAKNKVPNFINELRRHGAKPVAIIYINDMLFENQMTL